MRNKRVIALALSAAMVAGLTGCSTSIGSNTSIFISETTDAVSTMLSNSSSSSSSDSSSSEEDTSGKTALSAPGDFTVDADGNYSFSGVENASYYQVFIADADAEDADAYLDTTDQIEEDGSGTYTGNIAESLSYGYGDFTVRVVAYPDYSDETYKKSEASTASFTSTGEVDEPQFAYYWDCFTGTFDIQLINVESYEYESFPTLIEVTLTNEADSSDALTLTIENVSLDDDVYSASTTEVTDGVTYAVTADVTWDETYVTNPAASIEVGSVAVSSTASAITAGYGYLNTDIYSSRDYPAVAEGFDVAEGGSMGGWYQFTPYQVSSKGIASHVSFSSTVMYYIATPAEEVTEGSLYSYTYSTVNSDGSVEEAFTSVTGQTSGGGGTTGTLEIYEDGTFSATVDYVAGIIAAMTTFSSEIWGTWTDNGDGTINLYYDHTSTVLYDD